MLLSAGHGGALADLGLGNLKPPDVAALQQPLPGSASLPKGLVLDDAITLSTAAGTTALEIFSKYPLPPGVGPALENQLLSPTPTSSPVTVPPLGVSVIPLYLAYSGPAPTLPPGPLYVSAVNPATGQLLTYSVTLVPSSPAQLPPAGVPVSLPGAPLQGPPAH
jgi:hypothetical protein